MSEVTAAPEPAMATPAELPLKRAMDDRLFSKPPAAGA
jgi:hypothetical protein